MNETLNIHRRRGPVRDAGLTSLEWLLIVAAIAGLAAVAVVLVQTVVDSTAENMADHNPRQEAADFAANELTTRWQQETPNSASEARRLDCLKSVEAGEEVSHDRRPRDHRPGLIALGPEARPLDQIREEAH